VLFHELLHQRPGGLVIAALDRCSYRTHVIALLFEPVKVAELPHSCISTQLCGPGWKGIHWEYHNDQESQYGCYCHNLSNIFHQYHPGGCSFLSGGFLTYSMFYIMAYKFNL